jgi:D-glycerate 3-kinase
MAHERFQLAEFMRHHRLPEAFASIARNFYAPLADWVEKQLVARGRSGYVLGINGAQGTGKSTLSNFLAQRLGALHHRRVVELSIDDIYLTRRERERLARDVHPLLVTRGVPGTHDVALGIETIKQLRDLDEGQTLAVPRFDKAQDDQSPRASWPLAKARSI